MKILLMGAFLLNALCADILAQTNISGVINTYTSVVSIGNSGCSDSVIVSSAVGFNPGDSVLIIQMQGATIDTTNTALFGTVSNFNNSGNFEFLKIASVAGSTIRFTSSLTRNYSVTDKVQLVSKPLYTDAIVNGVLTAQTWNGTTGGVLTFSVSGNLTLNNNIDATDKGFRGGAVSPTYFSTYYSGFAFSNTPGRGGKKGESISAYVLNKEYGRAPQAGGGGGGNDINTAGGGGGNFGSGGHGGYYSAAPDTLWGMRGKSLSAGINQKKIFLGSGGGGGHQNNNEGTAGSNGGGIILIYANNISGNGRYIRANGSNVIPVAGIDGAGGGGAGGSIFIDANTFSTNLIVEANGGKGGDQVYLPQCHGNGGGGGGGVIIFSGVSFPANVTSATIGGAKGAGQCNNTPTDGIAGASGMNLFSWHIQESQILSMSDVTCFGLDDGTATAIASGNPPYQYLWTIPGGSTLTSSSIANLSAGNYQLEITNGSGCHSHQNFVITEPPQININIVGNNAGCGSLGSATVNATGGVGGFSYRWNTTPVQTTQTAVMLSANSYIVLVTDSSSCSNSDTIQILNSSVDFSIHSTPATCLENNGSVVVTHTGGTGPFSYQWTPTHDTTSSTFNNVVAGGYSVIAADWGTGCSQSLFIIVGNTSGINATIVDSVDATCETDDDGSATVFATGGQPPYFYHWPNGDTTSTTNHLSPGNYLAMVEDYNGCPSYASVTIGYNFSSPAIDLGQDTMPCIGTPYTIDAGPGFSSYLWSDNSTNQTLTVTSDGTFTVLVTNSNGCQNSDAIVVTFITCLSNGVIQNDLSDGSINIFPNPAKGKFHLNIKNDKASEIIIRINDLLGKLIYMSNEKMNSDFSKEINLSPNYKGIFFITILFDDIIVTKRIVIE